MVHGLDDGSPITPASQPGLLVSQELRQRKALTELLLPWPELAQALPLARSLGVMRWGASQPLDYPLLHVPSMVRAQCCWLLWGLDCRPWFWHG